MECLESVQCYRITNSDFFIEGAPRAMQVLLKLIQRKKKYLKINVELKTKSVTMLFTPFLFPSLLFPPAAKRCGHVVQGCITFF